MGKFLGQKAMSGPVVFRGIREGSFIHCFSAVNVKIIHCFSAVNVKVIHCFSAVNVKITHCFTPGHEREVFARRLFDDRLGDGDKENQCLVLSLLGS